MVVFQPRSLVERTSVSELWPPHFGDPVCRRPFWGPVELLVLAGLKTTEETLGGLEKVRGVSVKEGKKTWVVHLGVS